MVAVGRDASKAAVCIDFNFSGDDNQVLTVFAIFVGSPLYVPKPASSTYGTLPASCPGLSIMKEEKHDET